ncbi:hypothetical protein [Castellaniella defragrans]|uniref:Uncharacterized protein n=1 Tax=Castellaniella defragrans TaxID=75697 RepID=A0A7W9TQT5_CASDE|nr:hypothetical protein [Castellaniella defragrans]KAB0597979.1 hypothetical protein F7Q88_17805 [Castellaniella defragrans]MBB6085155.1 hypothetical protein [Castellaniella defragrans]
MRQKMVVRLKMQNQKRVQVGLVRFVVEGAAQDSARSLDLLRDIETTVEVNAMLSELFGTVAERCKTATRAICAKDVHAANEPIDDDGGRLHDIFDHAMSVFESLYGIISSRQKSAISDRSLRPDDGVVESFEQVLINLKDAHDSLNEMLWAVLEHDANLSPLSGKGPFTSVADLMAAIKS